jgi:hypothetical protein
MTTPARSYALRDTAGFYLEMTAGPTSRRTTPSPAFAKVFGSVGSAREWERQANERDLLGRGIEYDVVSLSSLT